MVSWRSPQRRFSGLGRRAQRLEIAFDRRPFSRRSQNSLYANRRANARGIVEGRRPGHRHPGGQRISRLAGLSARAQENRH